MQWEMKNYTLFYKKVISLVLLSYRRLSYKKACIPQLLNLKFTKIDKREVLIRSEGNVQNIISGVRVGLGEGAITDF